MILFMVVSSGTEADARIGSILSLWQTYRRHSSDNTRNARLAKGNSRIKFIFIRNLNFVLQASDTGQSVDDNVDVARTLARKLAKEPVN